MDVLTRAAFSAMGNTVDVAVMGDAGSRLVDAAQERIEELESRWSRFRDGSDVARLNAAGGRPVPVHRDTVLLVRYLVAAQAATKRAFDPTLGPELARLGYRASRTDHRRTSSFHEHAVAGTSLEATRIDERFGEVQLPPRATLDPGGLGKGLAADLAAALLRREGADGACVSIGGDLRCTGRGPIGGQWTIGVADAHDRSRTVQVLRLGDGAVIQASAVAAEAVWAEVAATAALVRQCAAAGELGSGEGSGRIAVRAVRADGSVDETEGWRDFVDE